MMVPEPAVPTQPTNMGGDAAVWRYADIRTVADIVRHWAATTPDRVAMIDGERVSTYRELDEKSNRIANALLAAGVVPGSHVAFLGKNCAEFFELWFAAAKVGAAIAPFNWRSPARELIDLVEDCRPPVVVVSQEFLPIIREVQTACHTEFEVAAVAPDNNLDRWLADQPATDPRIPLQGTETALLSYTSGTTGLPKGVQISHEAIDRSFLCSSLEPSLGMTSEDVLLVCMPCSHLTGSWVSLPAFYHGARIVIQPQFEPVATTTAVRDSGATVVCLVPAAMQAILDRPDVERSSFTSLRRILYAGSPISADTLRRCIGLFGCDFVQFYGATEMWIMTLLRPEQHDLDEPQSLTSCGTPVHFVETRVVDTELNEVADGEIGEILARSPVMFSGYWNQPEATAAAVIAGWYRTGDLARKDTSGRHHIIDRLNDMIITGGENVYSVEVERALYRHPDVAMAAVVGAPDPRWGERVTAFVLPTPGALLTPDMLTAHCRELIAGPKVPKTIHVVDELPVTTTGKIQKAVLRAQLRDPQHERPAPS